MDGNVSGMNNIKEYRIRANLSQGQLAEMVNVKQSCISRWESGVAYPEIETAKKLSAVLNIPFSLIYNHFPLEGPYTLPVYDTIHSNGTGTISTRSGSLLQLTQNEMRMLIPRLEAKKLNLTSDTSAKLDPGWFFGYYCASTNMMPTVLPNSVNVMFKTNTVYANEIHLISINGKDMQMARLVKDRNDLLAILNNSPVEHKYFRASDLKDGKVLVHGVLVQSRMSYLL